MPEKNILTSNLVNLLTKSYDDKTGPLIDCSDFITLANAFGYRGKYDDLRIHKQDTGFEVFLGTSSKSVKNSLIYLLKANFRDSFSATIALKNFLEIFSCGDGAKFCFLHVVETQGNEFCISI